MSGVFLTPEELAERWRMKGVRGLEDWRRKGTGPIFHRFNNKILYKEEHVIEFENSRASNVLKEGTEPGG